MNVAGFNGLNNDKAFISATSAIPIKEHKNLAIYSLFKLGTLYSIFLVKIVPPKHDPNTAPV